MKTRKASLAWSVLTIVTLLSFVLAACGPTPAPTKAPPPTEVPTAAPTEALAEGAPYKIGFCAAITGPGSSLGVPERNTAEMIAGQLEEEGGVVGPDGVQHAVEVIIYDTESNPDAAASVASRLITEDEVDVLVCGTLSGSSMAIMPLAAENEVPYISMASARAIIQDPETKESRKWAFKTPQENLHSGEWQALYLEAMGITTICDLYENTGYGQDCLANTKAAVEAKGIEVVYEDTFERSDTEFPQMAGVTGSGCEAVVVGAIPPGASMVTVAARDTDPDLPVIQGHGVCNTAFIELAGDAAEETVFPCGKLMIADLLPDDDPQRAMLQKYIEDYTEFTDGEPIDTFGGHALDALLWAEEGLASLEEGLSLAERRAAIRDYIEGNIKDWPGTGGVFNITPDDHLGLAYDALTFVKVENGTWVHFPPEQWGAPPVVAAVDFTAGMVSDVGGIDDASFNENTWKGFLDAQDYLGIKVTFLESQAQADYENNITEFAEQGYDMIITVGFLLGDATYKMAKQYPDVKFAIVDYPSGGEETPNLQGILFNVHEASFPVGYVAAAMADQLDPDDPIVAHVSGMQIPPVEEFIVAYEHGVKYYNEKYDKDVKFTGVYVGDFEAPDQGKLQGNSLIDEGADIIMGVGGKTGNGGITAAKERGKWGIGVDVDQYYTLPNERDILVTSTIKRLDKAVFSVVKSALEGTFEGGTNYIATLGNEGVGVGPFHDFEDKVPDNIKADLEQIQRDIIAGRLWTGWGEPPVVAAVDFTAGMVSDVGGIDDASFNENTWKGFLDAQDYLGIEVTFLESQAQADYENNITEFAEQGYDMIITVGFLLGDATYKMAAQYPDVKFAIVDYPSGGEETPNLQGILFNVHEASFPVGYVAAAMADQLDPDDPIVAHVSGMQIPPVEEFIVAYEHGVKYYNEKYDKDVKFTGVYVGDFEAPDQGKLQGNSLIDEGADIIMGVGGKTGNGGITAAKERGKWGIGVDVDQYYTLPNERDILVTSTIKRLDKAVFSVVKSAVEGTFEGGTNYIATLENEGVGVGPFHDFEDKVPDNIKADLEEIQRAIIAGELETGWPPE